LLLGPSESAWLERARWVLEHHALAYERRELLGFFDRLLACFSTRTLPGRLEPTLALVAPRRKIADSFELVRYADSVGRGAPLVAELSAEELSELAACIADSEIVLGPFDGVWGEAPDGAPAAAPEAEPLQLRGAFNRLRWRLHKTEFNTVFRGKFSYADIVCAGMVETLEPSRLVAPGAGLPARVGASVPARGPATKGDSKLADEFRDLVQWSQRLRQKYSRSRGP
jgi:glutathione S-transferase